MIEFGVALKLAYFVHVAQGSLFGTMSVMRIAAADICRQIPLKIETDWKPIENNQSQVKKNFEGLL